MNKFNTWHKLKEPPPEIDTGGNKHWYNKDGQLHREGGPAVIWKNGSEFWYKNNLLHREDGPATITTSLDRGLYFKDRAQAPDKRNFKQGRYFLDNREYNFISFKIVIFFKKLSTIF